MNDIRQIRLVAEGLWLVQSPRLHSVTTDAVLLAAFAKIPRGKPVADLGCGNGPLGILLLARTDRPAQVVGVDILPEACALARESARLSGCAATYQIAEGDYCQPLPQLPAGRFGLVVCNPPYFEPDGQQLALSPQRAGARHETTADLAATIAAAYRLLSYRGRLAMCLPPARLGEACYQLEKNCCHLKRLQLVHPRVGQMASLCLLEGVRGSKPGAEILPPLFLHGADNSYTPEALEYYGRFSASPEQDAETV
jgi:tRNA1(Val) A37 N6-methylase TrmN6